ncbi:nucleotidyltransferase family protein [Pseudoflavitalea sp. G-6-1-2]|uniref:nucleotidyltransferase family protein n=1 Tax=Pseudoflavitalea sp. G-6-1-2 TaxID=2728841 RepID=UPI001981E6C1|nr:nucleotidyltransferase family protein [Pseudoflavitalea sp. G-6-1-2]
MIKECIILAGGLGTRLRSAVPDLPKCMAPVAGRPFLAWVIDYYQKQGVERFVLALGYMHEEIEQFMAIEYPDLETAISIEDEPLGTGGAILKACEQTVCEDVLVLNGDTIFTVDVSKLSVFHEMEESVCTLTLKPMEQFDRYGVVGLRADQRIESFREKQFYESGLINGGVYALHVPSFLALDLPEKFSFEKDYLEKYYSTLPMYGQVQDGYFIDIGIPADFERAIQEFQNKVF